VEEEGKKSSIHPGIVVGLCILAFYLVLKLAVKPPLPSSLIFMYMSLATIGGITYLTLFHDLKKTIVDPVLLFLGGGFEGGVAKGGRYLVLVALPLVIWFYVYGRMGGALEPPLEQRIIHPAPPGEVMGLYNPFRAELEEGTPEGDAYVEEGREIYFKNCVFCHGDLLNGDGIFAHGLNPKPADFQDATTIAMLQESYLFWRVSTGGIGLPMESTPWNSAMPRWETMLTENERWKVIMFLYEYTGHSPRTWE